MSPNDSAAEQLLANLLDFKPDHISAKQTNIQIVTKLPHGSLITRTRVTVIKRTGHIDKTFALKGVINEF
jgi:hypothetical protein